MGTLGGDFLSSLPLHEYPPAFPLGADIQGMVTRGGCTVTLSPKPAQNPPFLCKAFRQAVLQRAIIQGTSLNFFGGGVVKGSDRRLISFFFFPTRFRFIFFPSD